jgi:hypothetical protein
MADIGMLVRPGTPAPARGTYSCTEPGCTGCFIASMRGAPLPPAHHPEALWMLAEIGTVGFPPHGARSKKRTSVRPGADPPGVPAASPSDPPPAAE